MNPVRFYSKATECVSFSNFAWFPIVLGGKAWKTNEHYYQAMKYSGIDEKRVLRIKNADGPSQAKSLGNDPKHPPRNDWEEIKDNVMRLCCLRKIQTHESVYNLLISTGERPLLEDSAKDYYWGIGAEGNGKNMLGIILMEIRNLLKDDFYALKLKPIPENDIGNKIFNSVRNVPDAELLELVTKIKSI